MLFYIDSSIYSPVKNKGKKRKDITHDNTKEDIKELKPNSSSESLTNINFIDNDNLHEQSNTDHKIDVKDKGSQDVAVTIELDSGIFISNIKYIDILIKHFYTQYNVTIYIYYNL